MSNVDWNLVIETLRDERCIILLGPELPQLQDHTPLQRAMIDFLNWEHDPSLKQLKYYEKDALFHFEDPILRTRAYFKIKGFYREILPRVLQSPYQQLSEISTHLIVSTHPALFLRDAFTAKNTGHHFAFYNKMVNPASIPPPRKQQPVIYNLFGSMEEEQSVILSHDDLYDFIFAILGERQLPTELRKSFQDAANILFIGFNFEKWYMQLLLRLLNLHDERFMFDRYASSQSLNQETQVFLFEQYRINFVEMSPLQFVGELYEQCKAAQLLRSSHTRQGAVYEQVFHLIEEDELEKALEMLQKFFQNHRQEELADDVLMLISRYRRLMRKINQDTIAPDKAEIEINKIRMALLDLNKEVKSLEQL